MQKCWRLQMLIAIHKWLDWQRSITEKNHFNSRSAASLQISISFYKILGHSASLPGMEWLVWSSRCGLGHRSWAAVPVWGCRELGLCFIPKSKSREMLTASQVSSQPGCTGVPPGCLCTGLALSPSSVNPWVTLVFVIFRRKDTQCSWKYLPQILPLLHPNPQNVSRAQLGFALTGHSTCHLDRWRPGRVLSRWQCPWCPGHPLVRSQSQNKVEQT